ncbi:MAG: aminodeoxychorismate/anthranilate synthase component II [Bacteroidetes Order II. Incertae sedis bacterium]|nr:aminodeoxychorismate/anthranilate synthase component II [Bacteroidetes Order II. bacterium]
MILFIDNYDSFTYNLVHLVGAITPDVEVIRNDEWTLAEIRAFRPAGILLSPGPGRPEEAGVMPELIHSLGAEIPMLGICLGHQAIGQAYGGTVTYAKTLMHGKTSPVFHQNAGVFQDVPNPLTATRYHSLAVDRGSLPNALEVTAWVEDGTIMGLRHKMHPVEGVQFHPESILTLQSGGGKIIKNWVERILRTV